MKWVLLGILIALVLVVAIIVWSTIICFGIIFSRPLIKKNYYFKPLFGQNFYLHEPKISETQKKYKEKPFEQLNIISSNLKLSGRYFDKPGSNKVIIFVHGYYSSGMRDIGYFGDLYDKLDVSLLIIDQRATGTSEGKYSSFGALERFDVREWIFYINARYEGKKEIYLHGISMGAATSLLTASLNGLPPSFKGVIADCGYSRIKGVVLYTGERLIKTRPFLLYWSLNVISRILFGLNLGKLNVSTELKHNKTVPILYIHGTKDLFVPYNMSTKNYKSTIAMKKFVTFEGAGHCECYLQNEELYESEVREFLNGK